MLSQRRAPQRVGQKPLGLTASKSSLVAVRQTHSVARAPLLQRTPVLAIQGPQLEPFSSSVARTSATAGTSQPVSQAELLEPYSSHKWTWRGHNINFATAGCGKPIILVHGFGASAGHYRKNIPVLAAAGYKVYALDLLGFGGSDKALIQYSMELWRDQILDFAAEFTDQPAVLVGNSIGSLACLMVGAGSPKGSIRGLVLLNSAGAMNNKGVLSDARIVLALPIFWLIDFLLSIRPIAQFMFNSFRSPENVRAVLTQVYVNQEAVDDQLVELIYRPSEDAGALDVFVSVITGPPGPKPWDLVPLIDAPLLVLWGDTDPFTPADGPVGRFLRTLADEAALGLEDGAAPAVSFHMLQAGHCPHDDAPDQVHAQLLPWLAQLDV